jgi:enolase 1/2/3
VKIASVAARQILDCKTRPMLEVEIHTEDGHVGRGAAPTGTSVGVHEAVVLRDDDPGEYGGLSVHIAVRTVEDVIAPAILGLNVTDQRALDERLIDLDGTSNKGRLGGNSVYSTSVAALRAAAAVAGVPTYEHVRRTMGRPALSTVPVPSFNMINGGRYGDVTQPFNEFIVIPHRAETIAAAVESGIGLFAVLAEVIADRSGRRPEVASSYGYVAPSGDPRAVLELLAEAVERADLTEVMAFALDCASSEMYDSTTQTYELNGRRVDTAELISYTKQLSEDFPLVFVEDLLDEDDWSGYPRAVSEIGRTIIVGDDLIATNRQRLERAAGLKAVDGFVLKPNQVGTITEALDCFSYAEENGLIAVPSGRSGGVIDDVVMDLSVGLAVPFQKNGAPRSGERIEKLNFLMRAAEAIPDCTLADLDALVRF